MSRFHLVHNYCSSDETVLLTVEQGGRTCEQVYDIIAAQCEELGYDNEMLRSSCTVVIEPYEGQQSDYYH